MNEQEKQDGSSPRRLIGAGLADVVFVFFSLAILQRADDGMLDDPGLGWHLRIADAMREAGWFLYKEQFCFPTEGMPWVTKAWLADILLRLADAWGGLNGIAVVSALTFAFVLRCLCRRLMQEGLPWPLTVAAVFLIGLGISPASSARPNLFTLLGVAWVCQVCEQFHEGRLRRTQTLWLIPLFALWPNLHGGFLAGVLILVVTFAVECLMCVASSDATMRAEAKRRVGWWLVLGSLLFVATLCNPYFFRLYLWNTQIVTDTFHQTQTSTEWRPPNFAAPGWYRVEIFLLLFPLCAIFSDYRPSLLRVGLCIVWLHFAVTSARYAPLWVIVLGPTLTHLLYHIPLARRWADRFLAWWSPDVRAWFVVRPREGSGIVSVVFAVALLLVTPAMGTFAKHNQVNLPTHELDDFLQLYQGEKVFHVMNWGGYLTWKGWHLKPRFQTFIDDRTAVHGAKFTREYFAIADALPGWRAALERYQVTVACVPVPSRLAQALDAANDWEPIYQGQSVVAFRKIRNGVP